LLLLSFWKNNTDILGPHWAATKLQFLNNTLSEKHNKAKCIKTKPACIKWQHLAFLSYDRGKENSRGQVEAELTFHRNAPHNY
jgi:hypothetical protein